MLRLLCVLLANGIISAHGFRVSRPQRVRNVVLAFPGQTRCCCLRAADPNKNTEPEKEKGILDFIFNPYESKIPKEIEKDIYSAEANTEAAKERGQRIGLYAAIAFTGILSAFFNGFLTELRGPTPDGITIDLEAAGFGWVTSNFLLAFLFTNKIGGLICLLGGGACGILAEAEYDTRRINAERIWDEMQRRRAEKSSGGKKQKRPKRRSGKETKRMGALSEVVLGDTDEPTTRAPEKETVVVPIEHASAVEAGTTEGAKGVEEPATKDDGIVGKIKGFYEKADAMAAAQALLLNKKLEDEGLIEKITDETGFKVIGKEAASKLKESVDKEK
jgi:hypothetical protein